MKKINFTAARIDLEINNDNNKGWQSKHLDENGEVIDLTNYTFTLIVKNKMSDDESEAVLNKDFTITTPASGYAEINLVTADWENLPVGNYAYYVKQESPTGQIIHLYSGEFKNYFGGSNSDGSSNAQVLEITYNDELTIEITNNYFLDTSSFISESGSNILTNKTIDDYTNEVHANALHFRVKATENISKGQPVKITGWNVGQEAYEVELASNATGVANGLASESMTIGTFGMMEQSGTLKDIDTSGFSEGSILYLNGSGVLTETEPTTGFAQPIAYVVRSHAINGSLQVNADYPKQDAGDVRFTPSAGLLSTNVNDALLELNTKINSENLWDRNESSGFLFPNILTDWVGIGTITPEKQLHILGGKAGEDDARIIIEDDGNGTGNGNAGIQYRSASGNLWESGILGAGEGANADEYYTGYNGNRKFAIGIDGHVAFGAAAYADSTNIKLQFDDEADLTNLLLENTGTTAGSDALQIVKTANGDPQNGWYAVNSGKVWKMGIDDSDGGKLKICNDWTFGNRMGMTFDPSNLFTGVYTSNPKSRLDVDGGIKCGNDAATAGADKVGTRRYYEDVNGSYYDICVKTTAGYAWRSLNEEIF